MNYLIKTTDIYRVETVDEVEQLHETLKNDKNFTLGAFSYKTKYIKEKGDIVGEYQIVTAIKIFNEEKEPENPIAIKYEVQF